MKKSTTLFFLILLSVGLIHAQENKHTIGCQPGAGLFFNFLGVLNNLRYCKANNLKPVVYWGSHNVYYTPSYGENVWEYFFEPIMQAPYSQNDPILNANWTPDGMTIEPIKNENCDKIFDKELRKSINSLITEFVRIKPHIMQEIETFYEKKMKNKNIIGIHLRGTDKAVEVKQVKTEDILEYANKLASSLPHCRFLIATDEEALLKKAQKQLKGKVIYYEAYRSKDGYPIHFNPSGAPVSHNYSLIKLAEEVIR